MATVREMSEKLRAMLPGDAVRMDEEYRAGVLFSAEAPLTKLREAASAIETEGFYLESLTGLDFQDTYELVYHFNRYEARSRFALRVLCGADQTPPSICDLFPAAQWLEREVRDFFGVTFAGNDDMRPLLLPEDADYHPLRKTFGSVRAYRKREEIYA